jgi:hypothetical protein
VTSIPVRRALCLLTALALTGCGAATTPHRALGGSSAPSPSASVAAADFVSATSQMRDRGTPLVSSGVRTLDPAVSYLSGPHFGVALASTATTNELTWADLVHSGLSTAKLPENQPLHAAPGHELLVVVGGRGAYPTYPDSSAASYAVVVDGRSLPFEGPFGGPDSVLVASVPTGSPARLEVTDSGRTQSIDLRTGAPGAVVAAEHPRRLAKVEDFTDLYVAGAPNKPVDQQLPFYSLDITVRLVGWETSHGWAPDGQAWLVLKLSSSMLLGGEVKLDLAKSLTVRTGAGKPVVLTGVLDVKYSPMGNGASSTQAVAVPAGTTSVSMALSTHGAILTGDGQPAASVRLPSSHSRATLTLAPETAG